jgi:hypothetical protein
MPTGTEVLIPTNDAATYGENIDANLEIPFAAPRPVARTTVGYASGVSEEKGELSHNLTDVK